MTTETTRPDPKVQISSLFEIGRLMVEQGLPAIDVEVRADGSLRLEAYSHNAYAPQTWDELLATVTPWIAALGLQRDGYSDAAKKRADGWHRSMSAWGELAGAYVTLHGAVAVPAPEGAEVKS